MPPTPACATGLLRLAARRKKPAAAEVFEAVAARIADGSRSPPQRVKRKRIQKNFHELSPRPAVAASGLFVPKAKPEERVPYVADDPNWQTEAGLDMGLHGVIGPVAEPWGQPM
jgi:hypothetical protein